MQEKESIMVVRCELKILSLVITVLHHSASFVMPNSDPRDGIFNLHLTTIKESYNLTHVISPPKENFHCDVTMTSNLKCPMSTSLCVVMKSSFKVKHSKSRGMQEKESNISVLYG